MAKSPDHPELNFVQAAGYTKGRPDGPPLWIVIHDMEAGESSDRAENTAAYFASGTGGRSVSSHYCVDDDSVVQCVRLADVAWTVGNRPGNNRGINWELSGFARQTRAQWLDEFGQAMFRQMAPYVRADAKKYGIPLRRCTVADLKARRPGITSHNDLRLAFGQTTHTDPGPNFPWDVFLSYMLEEDDMATPSEIWNHPISSKALGVTWAAREYLKSAEIARRNTVAIEVKIDALAEVIRQLTSAGGSVDIAAILAGVDRRFEELREEIRADVDAELDEQSVAGADKDT